MENMCKFLYHELVFSLEPPLSFFSKTILLQTSFAGVPKGVMLSQRNLFNSLKSFALSIDVLCTDSDTYIAFLPLAHVLEMLCEMLMVIHGVRQGTTALCSRS